VDDLVDGIYRLLLSDEHLPVNIGNPTETSILEFAKIIIAWPETQPVWIISLINALATIRSAVARIFRVPFPAGLGT